MFNPKIKLKYVGACVASVNRPQIPPVCANKLISSGLERKICFQGIGNWKNISKELIVNIINIIIGDYTKYYNYSVTVNSFNSKHLVYVLFSEYRLKIV